MVSGYQESSPLKTGSGYCRWGRHEAKYRLCEEKNRQLSFVWVGGNQIPERGGFQEEVDRVL